MKDLLEKTMKINEYGEVSEEEAMGWYFGMSNLALNEWDLNKALQSAPNWREVKSRLESYLGSVAESDEMYDGFIAEIEHWVGLAKKGDVWMKEEWPKRLAQAKGE